LPIMNAFRMEVYRHYVEHRNKGLGSFKMWVVLTAIFERYNMILMVVLTLFTRLDTLTII
jgi:hypothetical protein